MWTPSYQATTNSTMKEEVVVIIFRILVRWTLVNN